MNPKAADAGGRPRILAGNWKMHLDPAEALDYFAALAGAKGVGDRAAPGTRRVIFPPAYALDGSVQRAAAKAGVELGAQNSHWEEKGAYTGELSAAAMQKIGVYWVLLGHSERRQYFGETDETAANRFRQAAGRGLNVVFCVGERLPERESGQTEAVLNRQLAPFLEVLAAELARPTCPWPAQCLWSIAYEPVWAIGTGKTATTDQAEHAHRHIRKTIWDRLGLEVAQRMPILYGGSVTPENAVALLAQANVDGVLVGSASLKPESFARILVATPG